MLNRQIAPPFYRSTKIKLLEPEKIVCSNGLPIYLIQGGEQEVVRIEWIFNAGKTAETKIGQSQFTAQQLDKGTKKKTSLSIAEGFENFGAHIDVSAGNDYTTVTLYALTLHLHQVLPLVEEILRDATFPQDEFALAKNIALQQYQVNKEKTTFIASKQFKKALFGKHPYANEIEDTHLNELQSEDLKKFHQENFTINSVFISGKILKDDVQVIERISSNLYFQQAFVTQSTNLWPNAKQEHIDKAESVQSTIRYGKRTITRTHPDFISLIFTTHILGGYFGSRLMKNIREDKGLTYGIFGVVQPLKQQSILSIGADVNKENKEQTLVEINKEIDKLKTELIGEEEFENARNYFVGSLQSEVSTVFANSDKIKSIILNQLPVDYYQKMIDTIESINPEDVLQTANTYYALEEFTTVTVG